MARPYVPPLFPSNPTPECSLIPLVILREPTSTKHVAIYVLRDASGDGGVIGYRLDGEKMVGIVPVSRWSFRSYVPVRYGDEHFTLDGNALPWIARLISSGAKHDEAIKEVLGLFFSLKILIGGDAVVSLQRVAYQLNDGIRRQVEKYVTSEAPRNGRFEAGDYAMQRALILSVATAWVHQNVAAPGK